MTNRRWQLSGILVAIMVVALAVRAVSGDDPRPASTALPPGSAAPTTVPATTSARPSSPATPSTRADRCVADTVAAMTFEERVGQVLMIGTPVDSPGDLLDTVHRHHLGGVFLAGRSTRSAAALRNDIDMLQRGADRPLLVALDQEGGNVQTLKGRDFPIIPSAQRLATSGHLRDTVRASSRRLAGIGVNVNLAPVADTVPAGLGAGNPPIGAFRRQYGSDPDRVSAAIRTVVPASQDAGVLTVLKHFPGLGRVRSNTDTDSRVVDSTTTATDPYLEPFRAGIDAGSAGVMVSSAVYPKLDRVNIAAYSKPVITGLLRGGLGYRGLVMSDDLGAADAAATVRPGERAVRFVRAGGDMVLTIRAQDAVPMTRALISAGARSDAFAARVTDAAGHVIRAKYEAHVLTCS